MKKAHILLFPLIVFILIISIYGGVLRAGIELPVIKPLVSKHGFLLLYGFFASLISLERVVGIKKSRFLFAPISFIIGSFLLLFDFNEISFGFFVVGSMLFCGIYIYILIRSFLIPTFILFLGSLSLLLSSVLLFIYPLNKLSILYITFFVLTITGERVELSKIYINKAFVKLSLVPTSLLFVLSILSLINDIFIKLYAFGLILISIIFFKFDVAIKTVKLSGIRRYISLGVILAYAWLLISGLLILIPTGFYYDAFLHTIFLGFAFSMVFSHAYIIFPAL